MHNIRHRTNSNFNTQLYCNDHLQCCNSSIVTIIFTVTGRCNGPTTRYHSSVCLGSRSGMVRAFFGMDRARCTAATSSCYILTVHDAQRPSVLAMDRARCPAAISSCYGSCTMPSGHQFLLWIVHDTQRPSIQMQGKDCISFSSGIV